MKYIINIPDDIQKIIGLRQDYSLIYVDMTPYTEPDRKAIEDETWELAERIADMSYDDFISCFEGETEEYVYGLPYHEVKNRYEAWKNQKEDIHIGDEVIYNGDRVVVTDIFLQDITRLWIEGVTSSGKTVEALESDIKKTGRHFAEFEELLKKLVRCKDCKHWIPYDWMFSEVWQSKNMEDYPEDEMGCDCCDMNMGANDYCSRAERRGESDE